MSMSNPALPSSAGCSILCGGKLLQARRTLCSSACPAMLVPSANAKPTKPTSIFTARIASSTNSLVSFCTRDR
jgi:hypothetical protein